MARDIIVMDHRSRDILNPLDDIRSYNLFYLPIPNNRHQNPIMNSSLIRAKNKRLYLPDVIYFITAVTKSRQPIFKQDDNIRALRDTLRSVKSLYTFTMKAYVFLPDHFHQLIFIPSETTISKIL